MLKMLGMKNKIRITGINQNKFILKLSSKSLTYAKIFGRSWRAGARAILLGRHRNTAPK